VDAVAISGSKLVLSFDARVTLGAITADDEDLVRFEGTDFTILFDGSAHGVPAWMNLDAAHVLSARRIAMSFDACGSLPSVVFADEDVLEYDVHDDAWEVVRRLHSTGWEAQRLDAWLPPRPRRRRLPADRMELVLVMPLLLLARRRRGSAR
jgi:hypothetical protein